jgi:hypothetical protein
MVRRLLQWRTLAATLALAACDRGVAPAPAPHRVAAISDTRAPHDTRRAALRIHRVALGE